MLNLLREGEEDYIKASRYRRRLKIFENFLFHFKYNVHQDILLYPLDQPFDI